MNKKIVVISGLPRSGTSLMAQILDKGGLEVVCDGKRKADGNNPRGYYELEKVKQIEKDSSWLKEIRGKAIKIVSPLLKFLPDNFDYQIIFVKRNLEEVMASQREMLLGKNKGVKDNQLKLKKAFKKHLKDIERWIENQKNIEVIYVDHGKVIKSPEKEIEKIACFLKRRLDIKKTSKTVDPLLYRQRSSKIRR